MDVLLGRPLARPVSNQDLHILIAGLFARPVLDDCFARSVEVVFERSFLTPYCRFLST
jgi:hypothetical protein